MIHTSYAPPLAASPAFAEICQAPEPENALAVLAIARLISDQTFAALREGALSVTVDLHELEVAAGCGPVGPHILRMAGFERNECGGWYSHGKQQRRVKRLRIAADALGAYFREIAEYE